ncbi:universal stress protein [Tropicimonas sp. TH_r6]|uniref:universal stress protein n=1 Tax=Tropicimonas sp. TH_r6 TaxID=3082085 RepID=UPI0029540F74|nr:universal stress protein [Tropicimonas sp. TH_r6]MDV7145992.1 universal stress protein [Tropicimonas sp. TH_r6]
MTCKFVVGFDGSEDAQRALDFALDRARNENASILVAHVLEWSQFSFLTPTELEERHKRRKEEIARAEEAVLRPVKERLAETGLEVETIIRHGHVANTINEIAVSNDADQIFIGRKGEGSVGARLFGSVPGALVQISSVPCTIVP